ALRDAVRERDRARAAEAEAKEQRDRADARAEDMRWALAGSRGQQAELAWRAGDATRALRLLDEVPTGLRSWDWGWRRRQYHGGLFTLAREKTGVLAVSPDGARLATAGT